MDIKLDEDAIRRAASDGIVRMREQQVRAIVESTHCETHEQNARLTWTRVAEGRLEFQVAGCCDELRERARRAAEAAPAREG